MTLAPTRISSARDITTSRLTSVLSPPSSVLLSADCCCRVPDIFILTKWQWGRQLLSVINDVPVQLFGRGGGGGKQHKENLYFDCNWTMDVTTSRARTLLISGP